MVRVKEITGDVDLFISLFSLVKENAINLDGIFNLYKYLFRFQARF
jgi:hypothetical protein